MRRGEVRREIDRVLRELGAEDRLVVTISVRRSHFIVRDAAGNPVVICAGTPGDGRWKRNLRADLRRAARASGGGST